LLLTRDIEKLLWYYACEYGERTGWQAVGAPSLPSLLFAVSPWNQAVLIPSDRAMRSRAQSPKGFRHARSVELLPDERNPLGQSRLSNLHRAIRVS